MANIPSIRITATPKKAIPVELLGTTYQVKPPKAALLLAISRHADKTTTDASGLNRDFNTIVQLMFGKNAEAIRARLSDPEDELDIDHIFEVVEAITEDGSGNPTS